MPDNLQIVNCYNNQLTSLPILPNTLERLFCSKNKLTTLPTLPATLEDLYCDDNQLTILPMLPANLEDLDCDNNQLTSLPTLPANLYTLDYSNNPIYEVLNTDNIVIIKQKINIINRFRYLYYSLKYKNQFRKWLWEKIREPRAIIKYHPDYLITNLGEDTELDDVLENW